MANAKFDPGKIIGSSVVDFSREELCSFASELCSAIKKDAGTGVFRGGVYPSNISRNEDGSVSLGPAARSAWEGEELGFIAPELYWNGKRSPASDVYSVGMVMYYAVSGGKLPFEGECREPQVRRMSGEQIRIPNAAGRRMGEIIAKALSFKAEDRYQSMDEMKAVLDSCIKNLFAVDTTAAEAFFGKNDDDLNEIERMMVGIMERGVLEREMPETEPPEPQSTADGEDEPEEDNVKVYPDPAESAEPEPIEKVLPMFTIVPADEPEAPQEPAITPISFSETPKTRYSSSLERERKIRQEVKKRRRRPLMGILLLSVVLIVLALVFNIITKRPGGAEVIFGMPEQGETVDPSPVVIITPDPAVIAAQNPTPSPEPAEPQTTEPPKEHSYQIFTADVSWTEAEERCESMGGHLVSIADIDELQRVIDLAEEEGVTRVWVGCRRINGEMVWVTEENINYYPWAKGEPSFVDSGDDVDEDYVLLWDHNGWCYNDSRDDPCADYPEMYSGNLAFVCEIG